jgi:hypothetical protein
VFSVDATGPSSARIWRQATVRRMNEVKNGAMTADHHDVAPLAGLERHRVGQRVGQAEGEEGRQPGEEHRAAEVRGEVGQGRDVVAEVHVAVVVAGVAGELRLEAETVNSWPSGMTKKTSSQSAPGSRSR